MKFTFRLGSPPKKSSLCILKYSKRLQVSDISDKEHSTQPVVGNSWNWNELLKGVITVYNRPLHRREKSRDDIKYSPFPNRKSHNPQGAGQQCET